MHLCTLNGELRSGARATLETVLERTWRCAWAGQELSHIERPLMYHVFISQLPSPSTTPSWNVSHGMRVDS